MQAVFPQFGYISIGVFVAALAAFWPRYFGQPFALIDTHTHVHAATMVTWCGMLIAQPLLVRFGRRDWHRAVGRVSYLVAPAVLVSSVLLAHLRFRSMDEAVFAEEAPYVFLPLSQVLLFAASYGLAIWHRRLPALHARFMIGTALTLMDPVLGRILFFYAPPLAHPLYYQAITFGLTDVILLALAVRDRAQPRSWWAFPMLLAIALPVHLFWFLAWDWGPWLAFSRWFRELPLP